MRPSVFCRSNYKPHRNFQTLLQIKLSSGHARLSPSEFKSSFDFLSELWGCRFSFDWSFFMRLTREVDTVVPNGRISAADASLTLCLRFLESQSPVCALVSENGFDVAMVSIEHYFKMINIDVVDAKRLLSGDGACAKIGVLTPQRWADVVLPSLFHPGAAFNGRYRNPHVIVLDHAILDKLNSASIPFYFYEKNRGVDATEHKWLKTLSDAWISQRSTLDTGFDEKSIASRIDDFLLQTEKKRSKFADRLAKMSLWNLEQVCVGREISPQMCSLRATGRFDITVPPDLRSKMPEHAAQGFMSTLFYAGESVSEKKVFGQMEVFSVNVLNLLDLFSCGVTWLGFFCGGDVWVPGRRRFKWLEQKLSGCYREPARIDVKMFHSQESLNYNLQKAASENAIVLTARNSTNERNPNIESFFKLWLSEKPHAWKDRDVVIYGFPFGLTKKAISDGFSGAKSVHVYADKSSVSGSMSTAEYGRFSSNLALMSLGGSRAERAATDLVKMMSEVFFEHAELCYEREFLSALIEASARNESAESRKLDFVRIHQSHAASKALHSINNRSKALLGVQLFF